MARVRLRVGTCGLRLAHACFVLLLLMLAWGPHWPFSRLAISAPPEGVLNTGFDLADLLFVGILMGWGVAILCRTDSLRAAWHWITWLLLVFTLASGLAIVGALDQPMAARFAARSAGLLALYLFVRCSMSAGRLAPSTIARWLAPGLAFNGLVAIAQAIHQNPLGLTWLGEPRMLRSTPGTAVVLVHGKPILRAYGVLPHPNVLGGLLAAALPLAAGLLLHSAKRERTASAQQPQKGKGVHDALVFICLALILAGIVLSFSRSAWLGLLCGLAYLVGRVTRRRGPGVLRRLKARSLLLGAGICLVVTILLFFEWDAVLVRLQPTSNSLEQASIQQRLSLVEQSLKVIARRPLTGVGGNNFALTEERYLHLDAQGASSLLPVHDTYLLAQAELGPVGALSWLALMMTPLLALAFWGHRRKPNWAVGTPDEFWPALAGSSLVLVAVTGFLDFYIWVNEPVAVLWIITLAIYTSCGCSGRSPRCHASA